MMGRRNENAGLITGILQSGCQCTVATVRPAVAHFVVYNLHILIINPFNISLRSQNRTKVEKPTPTT